MKNFYEVYNDDEFVTTLLTQVSWSGHLVILFKAKTEEERHFYISLCNKENYSARELGRQLDSGYYETYMLSKEKILPEPIQKLKGNPFLDSYVIEFLDLPMNFKESDLNFKYIRFDLCGSVIAYASADFFNWLKDVYSRIMSVNNREDFL